MHRIHAANDNELVSFNSLERRAYEHLLRRVLSQDSRPAVVMLHAYQWWRAAGSGMTSGLFYKEPEQQLTVLSHVRRLQGETMCIQWAAVCLSACHSVTLRQACQCRPAGGEEIGHLTLTRNVLAVLRRPLTVAAHSGLAELVGWCGWLQGGPTGKPCSLGR